MRTVWSWLLFLGLSGLLLGCNKQPSEPTLVAPVLPEETMPAPTAAFDVESGPHAAGKRVMVASGCFRCHAVDGARGPVEGPAPDVQPGAGKMRGGGRGPDLRTVGKDPEHTVAWLEQFIRNPKSIRPRSRMPAFDGKIKPDDLRALVAYLASLK